MNRRVSLVAAFFGLVGCAIQAVGNVFQHFSLVLLRTRPGVSLLNSEQLPISALLLAKLNDQTVLVALVFFAMYCLLIGYLILRSTFLPRFLGASMVLAGLGWLTFLYEPLANPFVSVPPGARHRCGRVADVVAARDGREGGAMAGTGQRNRNPRMKSLSTPGSGSSSA